MPRLFAGIEIPTPIADRLSFAKAAIPGARWIDPQNYHLTLRFIGDVDGATARDFIQSLGQIEAAPFELKLDGLGSFGGNKPRAIFASIASSPALEIDLERATERAAREAGLPPEPRNFKPHVTLARLRGARPCSGCPVSRTARRFPEQSISRKRIVSFCPDILRWVADPMSSKPPIRLER